MCTSIREATEKDIPQLTDMAMDFYREGEFKKKGLGFDLQACTEYMQYLIANESAILLVAEVSVPEQRLVGSVAGMIEPWFLDFRQKMLMESWWWVNLDARGDNKGSIGGLLLDRFEEKAKDRGVQFCVLSTREFSQLNALGRIWEWRGYKPFSHVYMKVV